MRWVVPPGLDGERADKVLAVLGEVSRAAARSVLEQGLVLADGALVAPAGRLAAGVVLEGEIPAPAVSLVPEPVDFEVVFEDEHLAVVDKPSGVVTHPGAGRRSGTLAAGLLHRWPDIRGVGDAERWGIVHRLDRDTSGLLVVALTAETHAALRTAIKERRVTREYLALVLGALDAPTGTVEAPMMRDPARPTRMRIHPEGRRAVTHFRVEESLPTASLLWVTLETGRTHQIRVHLASIGLPVAGDRVYGNGAGSPRLFLHAARLCFDHPVRKEVVVDVSSPLPGDLSAVLGEHRSP